MMKDEVGIGAPDTFDILTERTRGLRAKRDHIQWCSISLEVQGVPITATRSYGEARIDNSLFRNLMGAEPTSFRVEPGPHTVTVHLSRWLRLRGYGRSSKISIQVAVQAGEQVNLVCGLRPGAKEEWTKIRMARIRPILILCIGSLLALFLGWFLFAILARLLAPAAIYIAIRGVPMSQTLIGAALRTAVLTPIILSWCLLARRLIVIPNRQDLQSLRYRFGFPYYLKKSEEPLHGRQPAN
jgi:hypothetical protein